MTDQQPDKRDAIRYRFDIFKSIDRLRSSTWLTVVFERLWPLVLPLLLSVAVFLCLSWFGIFRIIPDALRLALLGLFVLSLPLCLYLLLRFRLPDHSEISQRLESVNTLDHQPITDMSEQASRQETRDHRRLRRPPARSRVPALRDTRRRRSSSATNRSPRGAAKRRPTLAISSQPPPACRGSCEGPRGEAVPWAEPAAPRSELADDARASWNVVPPRRRR